MFLDYDMGEPPKKVQVIRSHQNVNEYMYKKNADVHENSYEQILLDRKDYQELGWKRLRTIQALPFNEQWPITVGNIVVATSSGIIGQFNDNQNMFLSNRSR
jgi:hypothetical protein